MSYILKKILLGVVYFIFVYSIPFVFLPFGLGSRMILSSLGFLILFMSVTTNPINLFLINKFIFFIIIFLFVIAFWSVTVIVFNNTKDYEFVNYGISVLLMLAAAYFVAFCTKNIKGYISEHIVIDYIILVVLIQNIISLGMFLNPNIDTLFRSLLLYDDSVGNVILDTKGFRINGFGANFFGAGIVNAFTLVLTASRVLRSSGKMQFYHIFSFIIITAIGVMVARTTIIGTMLGLMLTVFVKQKNKIKFAFKFIAVLVISLGVIIITYQNSSNEIKFMIDKVSRFGFEFIYNYFERGEITTASTESMKDMYIFPQKLKTYLIGDGFFKNPTIPNTFYMDTDIGYLRMLFYFGMIGILLFSTYQAFIAKYLFQKSREYKPLYFFLFILLLLLNLKGFTDYSYLFFILFFAIENNPMSIRK